MRQIAAGTNPVDSLIGHLDDSNLHDTGHSTEPFPPTTLANQQPLGNRLHLYLVASRSPAENRSTYRWRQLHYSAL